VVRSGSSAFAAPAHLAASRPPLAASRQPSYSSPMTRRPAARLLALRLSQSLLAAALVAGGPWAAGAQTTTASVTGSSSERSARVAARGLDPARLARLDAVLQRYVDEKRVAGIVSLVLRDGQVAHLKAFGQRDVERAVPMTTDTLFRIASMSKAVTSVAVMMLQEEGRLLLSDPVSKFLPAYANTTVAVPLPPGAPAGSRPGVVPAKRQITIRDLLTHTAGISYGNGNPAEADYARPVSSAGTSPTRTSRLPHRSTASRPSRSTRSRARSTSTGTRATSSAAWSRWPPD
jgi:CubicO group peptidase (beta-lactamase class C family)